MDFCVLSSDRTLGSLSPPRSTVGQEKAIVALAHSILVIIYHVLSKKKPYTDLGADYFDKLDTTRIQQHHTRRLEQLGFAVTLTPKEAGCLGIFVGTSIITNQRGISSLIQFLFVFYI